MQLLTTDGWAGVIANLREKQQAAQKHTEELQAQKHSLALEAAMGSPEARKQLAKINVELSRLSLEAEDWHAAITQAEASKKLAEKAEKDAAELERQRELSKLASTVISYAAEFTDALRQAVKAGERVKLVVQNMANRATSDEQSSLNRILERNAYMRCAEFVGLRNHLDFPPYSGPREHLGPLENEIGVYLSRWLNNNGKKE
jgi:hypothetical protein